ncbi:hypothetical protein [Nonomuraea solani]|uniref:hypothetical protein n=1 Tax=Nonomuraea solani TaxID=1144553 RepID=UPI000CDE5BD5|nr:hypothetical protein [Nonomuraea solani]
MLLRSHAPCDSSLGRRLDGTFEVRDLTTAFAQGSGMRRGVHAGDFVWHVGDITFTVFEGAGAPSPGTQVVTWGGSTGLILNRAASVLFPAPIGQVEVTLVHFSQPARVTAFDSGGNIVSTVTMTAPPGVTQTMTLNGPDIGKLEIECPQGETLLTRLCPAPAGTGHSTS